MRMHGVEIHRVENCHSTRLPDNVSNFVAYRGWAIDFASRGGATTADAPWPIVKPLDEYMAGYGGVRIALCVSCGLAGNHKRCEGPFPVEWHLARAREKAADLISELMLS